MFATAVFKAIKLSQLGGEQQQQHVRCVRDFQFSFCFFPPKNDHNGAMLARAASKHIMDRSQAGIMLRTCKGTREIVFVQPCKIVFPHNAYQHFQKPASDLRIISNNALRLKLQLKQFKTVTLFCTKKRIRECSFE